MGVVRFRDRVFTLARGSISKKEPSEQLLREMHKTIKKVTGDVERLSFNTAIATLMVYTNTLTAAGIHKFYWSSE